MNNIYSYHILHGCMGVFSVCDGEGGGGVENPKLNPNLTSFCLTAILPRAEEDLLHGLQSCYCTARLSSYHIFHFQHIERGQGGLKTGE